MDPSPVFRRSKGKRYSAKSWTAWTTPRPSHRPMEPPIWNGWFDVDDCLWWLDTSDNMLLMVGSTKSVVVIVISGMKNNLNWNLSSVFSFSLERNLVLVWKVLQGVGHGDFSRPVKTLPQCSPECKHISNSKRHLLADFPAGCVMEQSRQRGLHIGVAKCLNSYFTQITQIRFLPEIATQAFCNIPGGIAASTQF